MRNKQGVFFVVATLNKTHQDLLCILVFFSCFFSIYKALQSFRDGAIVVGDRHEFTPGKLTQT